jgi:hypothetical protein
MPAPEPVTLLRPGRTAGRQSAAPLDAPDNLGDCIALGHEVIRLVPAATDEAARSRAEERTADGSALYDRADVSDRARLHVVSQTGRRFQQDHPNSRVLVDRGRFLLVDLDPDAARDAEVPGRVSVRPLSALAGAGGVTVFEVSSRAPAPLVPAIEALLGRISRSTYEHDLRWLAGLPTRLSDSAHFRTACDFAEHTLAGLGYQTSRQDFLVLGRPCQNVIARRRGTGPAGTRGMALVTAHLDSVNQAGGPDAPAPGADDNASGSAGVLEIGRALAQHVATQDLMLVLFGGEEQGLLGSRHFVQQLSLAQRARVRAVVNMDMIGVLNTDAPSVLIEGRATSQPLIDRLATAGATYTNLQIETSLHAANSDHVPFLDRGLPAVLTIEGADATNETVHSDDDILDRINLDLALEVLRMNTAAVAEILA